MQTAEPSTPGGPTRPLNRTAGDRDRAPSWRLVVAILLLGMLLLSIHAIPYLSFFSDDSMISLRYAQRLAAGDGLTWNDGERVEGYTNLLFVLVNSGLGALGVDLLVAARIVGCASVLAMAAAILRLHPPRDVHSALPATGGVLLLVLSGPIVVWAVGGLEQPLLSALLLWGVVYTFPLLQRERIRIADALPAGVLLALAALTRADGIVLTVALCVGFALARGLARRDLFAAAGLALIPFLAVLGQNLFRLSYYGDFVPNTARAKVAFTGSRLLAGLQYVLETWSLAIPVVALVVAIVALRLWRNDICRRRLLMLAGIAGVWVAYVVVVGGDYHVAHRHLVPLFGLAALACAEVLSGCGGLRRGLCWAGLIIVAGGFFAAQIWDVELRRGNRERWEWRGIAAGRVLRSAFAEEQPLVAVTAAGALPFTSQLPSLDMLGLNDRWLTAHRSEGFGQGMIGHELGNAEYVLRRAPDMIVFMPGDGINPGMPWAQRLLISETFQHNYRLIHLHVDFPSDLPWVFQFRPILKPHVFDWTRPDHYVVPLFVRWRDGPIGVRRSADRVEIPGYLLAHRPATTAVLAADNSLVAQLGPGESAQIEGLRLEAGAGAPHLREHPESRLICRVHAMASSPFTPLPS